MTVTQLRCFYEVVATGSFSKAADLLYMSQSSISKHIGQLEEELGIILFSRQNKRKPADLTDEGKSLLPYCRSVLLDMRSMYDEATRLRHTTALSDNTIRICGIPTMSFYGCIKLFNLFSEAYPQYDLIISEADETEVYTSLHIGICDIAFCSDPSQHLEKYQTLLVAKEHFRAAMARKYWAFGDKEEITMGDLKGLPLVLNRPDSLLYDMTRDTCIANGFNPQIKLMASRQEGIMDYLAYNPCCYVGLERVIQRHVSQQKQPLVQSVLIKNHPCVNFLFFWDTAKVTSAMRSFISFAQNCMPPLFAALHPEG